MNQDATLTLFFADVLRLVNTGVFMMSPAHRGDVLLALTLTDPSHSLLPSLPPSHHHTLTITLSPSHNPMLAMEQLFKGKQTVSPAPQTVNLSESVLLQYNQLVWCSSLITGTSPLPHRLCEVQCCHNTTPHQTDRATPSTPHSREICYV